MLQRMLRAPLRSFFLFGARGTGKSTWARTHFPGKPYFDLLDQAEYFSYQRDPGRFWRQLSAIPDGETVVVDEIQRIPELLNEVHRAIEMKQQRFVLLGSSSRKLKRAGVNLLGGRASLRTMFPLLPAEIGDEFDLDDALRFGTLPIIWTSQDKAESLQAYTVAYVSEEVRAEALARDLGAFLRFLSVAALFHGQTMNMSAVARDCGVSRSTVEGYFSVLEDTMLSWTLPAFETTAKVRERAHSKLFWIDAGIVRSLKGNMGAIYPEERGALLEGFVANVLRATLSYEGSPITMTYMPKNGTLQEVDFILRRHDELVSVEVKSSSNVDSASLKGLRSIKELKGLQRRLLVCRISRKEITDDGIELIPVEDFCRSVSSDWLFRN